MTTARNIQQLEERIVGYPGPVLSVYLSVNLAFPENQKKGYAIRLKSALRERGVPRDLAERVMELFQVERPQSRTMVVFAAPDGLIEVYRLRVDLPEEIRWGEPYVAPLVLAFDEHEPY